MSLQTRLHACVWGVVLFLCCYGGLDVRSLLIISVHFVFGLLITDVFVYFTCLAIGWIAVWETIRDIIFQLK